jgi:hypothetical protein
VKKVEALTIKYGLVNKMSDRNTAFRPKPIKHLSAVPLIFRIEPIPYDPVSAMQRYNKLIASIE